MVKKTGACKKQSNKPSLGISRKVSDNQVKKNNFKRASILFRLLSFCKVNFTHEYLYITNCPGRGNVLYFMHNMNAWHILQAELENERAHFTIYLLLR